MKYYRQALPVGSHDTDDAFTIYFEDLSSREYVDASGAPIDVSSLSPSVQNNIAEWEDAFEDGFNEFDGIYERSVGVDGSMIRRRAWRAE